MPDKKLPPLPKEALDGESEKVELNFKKCTHKGVEIVNSQLKCKCGAGWQGANIALLYKAFKEQ